ncbi:5, 5 -p-1,p-4-tetraphosphate phosphorylase 2 [Fusarium longipes]|uniref:5, 5-p-1,p-4-tetraphosphate phosphorylase 2 n=1 Tax=Fusarium longipes TaxID=694270 RepID=A0A395RXD8_9HYPO|nr:5, 5 -p-1,p-4-tetraphosphate phosphorylase 2 [Fusarium longipes]
MDESVVLTKFDSLNERDMVFFDERQEVIQHDQGGLKVGIRRVRNASVIIALIYQKFQFIVTSALVKKPTFQTTPGQAYNDTSTTQKREGSDINTASYEICDVGKTHFLVANKFALARPHLMLLTSDEHRRQYESLDQDDWRALSAVLNDLGDGYVAFFNCGQDGGCSRLHKHMQLTPKPKDSFAAFLDCENGVEPGVPFQWFHHRLKSPTPTPDELLNIYRKLLSKATNAGKGLSEHADNLPAGSAVPHNMLVTNQWMIVLPRRRASVNKEAGANALGMMGVVAVATRVEMDNWLRVGPVQALEELGVPVRPGKSSNCY